MRSQNEVGRLATGKPSRRPLAVVAAVLIIAALALPAGAGAYAVTGDPGPRSEPTVITEAPAPQPQGFDWSDAALGAAIAVVGMSLAGGVLITARRRTAAPAPSA
jgi:hypothetical protein